MIRKEQIDAWLAAPTCSPSSEPTSLWGLWALLCGASRGASSDTRNVLIATGSSIVIILRHLVKSEYNTYIGSLAFVLDAYGDLLRDRPNNCDRLSQAGESFEEEAGAIFVRYFILGCYGSVL